MPSHRDALDAARDAVVNAAKWMFNGAQMGYGEGPLMDAVEELEKLEAATCPKCSGSGDMYPPMDDAGNGHVSCPACHGTGRTP